MPEFVYQAYQLGDKGRRKVSGTVMARDRSAALKQLDDDALVVARLTRKPQGFLSNESNKPPNMRQLASFSRMLGTLLQRGIPINRALEMLREDTENVVLRAAVDLTQRSITEGRNLSDAMRRSPKVFGTQFVALVELGDTSGKLDEVFLRMAQDLRNRSNLRDAIRGGLIYPAIQLVAAFAVTISMLIFVVPTLSGLLKQVGGKLPALTQFVVNAADLFRNYPVPILLFVTVVGWGGNTYYRTAEGKERIHDLMLRLPVVGPMLKKATQAQYCSSMAMAMESGVNLSDALTLSRQTVGNAVYARALRDVDTLILDRALAPHNAYNHFKSLFSSRMRGMITVGFETGNLDAMFREVSEIFSEEVQQAAGDIAKTIEPLIIIIVGLLVGVIVIALFLPFVEIISSVLNQTK